ncbi:MAG: hypothetical protein NC395_01490 [Prevotella sp.]|nr:hypothetical protein [Prevotella sp.]
MKIKYNDLLGKVLLVGITYEDGDGNVKERRQFYGTVTAADKGKILIEQKNGEVLSLPPDLGAVKPAPEGEYRLHSTGEVVVNPDYLSTWISRTEE